MPLIEIASYYSRWDLDTHNGRVALYDATNNQLDNRVYTSPEEFQIIVDLLRNESYGRLRIVSLADVERLLPAVLAIMEVRFKIHRRFIAAC